jgi:hypothetical protein
MGLPRVDKDMALTLAGSRKWLVVVPGIIAAVSDVPLPRDLRDGPSGAHSAA